MDDESTLIANTWLPSEAHTALDIAASVPMRITSNTNSKLHGVQMTAWRLGKYGESIEENVHVTVKSAENTTTSASFKGLVKMPDVFTVNFKPACPLEAGVTYELYVHYVDTEWKRECYVSEKQIRKISPGLEVNVLEQVISPIHSLVLSKK